MSSDRPEQPLKWLLSQVEQLYRDDVISLGTYELIMSGYAVAKRRYDTASKLRQAQGDLALYRRNQAKYEPDSNRYRTYAAMIERRIERIKKLEEEMGEL